MMIEMKVLKVEPRGQTHLIALGDRDQRIVLPFFVDPTDARAISAALSGEPSDRPATHDLLHSIVTGFNIAVHRVIVNDIRGGRIYARIVLEAADGTVTEIDARLSDAVALALRDVAPIYVTETVLAQAGMDYPWYRFTIPLFIDKPLAFEPGERWQYSNAGFIVLGAILQKVSEQSYFDYVREHIYKPADMHNTDAYEMDRPIPNLAIGYTRAYVREWPELGPWRSNLFLHTIKGGPAGGGFSTVEDLFKFDQALRGHRLLSPEHTNTVLAGKVDLPGAPGAQYAYGFFDDRTKGSRIVGHGGGFAGINGQLDMYLDLGYTVAVLSNYSPPAAQHVAMRLREMITHA